MAHAKTQNITIEPYNPDWPQAFNHEKMLLKRALKNNCLEIIHIGSTAVPNLPAKPIIDIIAVVEDPTKIENKLKKIGYYFKGEYNIPFRYLYGKKDPCKVNLHVFQPGNPEIELNTLFRDYLRSNPISVKEYAELKMKLIQQKDFNKKDISGFTNYNLGKNEFISKIIEASGFKGLCPRLCFHDLEWQAVRSITGEKETIKNKDSEYFVLYEGAKIVAAACVKIQNKQNALLTSAGFDPSSGTEYHLAILLNFIEKWANAHSLAFAQK